MTRRSLTLVSTLAIILSFIFFPSIARVQEKTEPTPSAQQAKPEVTDKAEKQGALAIPSQTVSEPEPAKTPTTAAPEKEKYTVKEGDTLWDISQAFLKDPFLWPLIWKENPAITNPDLIYPGNIVAIPNLGAVERAMANTEPAAAAPSLETSTKPETAKTESPASANVEEQKPAAKAVVPKVQRTQGKETTSSSGSKLILPDREPIPVVDKYTMLSAGFISPEKWDDIIIDSREPQKMVLGYDDEVYLRIVSKEQVNVGDKFLIFSALKKVKHPKTGKKLGNLIKVLGILEVTVTDPAVAPTARITLSFDPISKGSMLAPYQEPSLLFSTGENDGRTIEGSIVEVTDTRTVNGQVDIVFLDKGSIDGVKPGDRFDVFRDPVRKGMPKRHIGWVKVFLVKERTATAIVVNSTDPIARGNQVALAK